MDTSGIERDGAALLLARLYTRHVASCLFDPHSFCPDRTAAPIFQGSYRGAASTSRVSQAFSALVIQENRLGRYSSSEQALCIMQTVAEVLKTGGMGQLRPFLPTILELSRGIGDTTLLNSNTVVRKYIVKIAGRVGLRLSPPPRPRSRPGKPRAQSQTLSTNSPQLGKYFHDNTAASQDEAFGSSRDEEVEVPAEVEEIIGGLLGSLQDKVGCTEQSTLSCFGVDGSPR
jgi:hypothetical protein